LTGTDERGDTEVQRRDSARAAGRREPEAPHPGHRSGDPAQRVSRTRETQANNSGRRDAVFIIESIQKFVANCL
jgi:hypothetical protein